MGHSYRQLSGSKNFFATFGKFFAEIQLLNLREIRKRQEGAS